MKRNLLIVLSILFFYNSSYSQNKNDVNEKIALITDRNLYLTGENILINLLLITDNDFNKSDSFSKVAYVELFDNKQKSILKEKVQLINNSSELYIKIPDNIASDNYILIAYTKYQKHFCKDLSYGKLISIINPSYIRFDDENDTIVNSSKLKSIGNNIAFNGIKISLNNDKFKTREKVNLTVNFSDINRPKNYKYVLSVVRKGTIANGSLKINPDNNSHNNIADFPKEKRIGLTGILIDKNTNNPISGKEIYLTGLKSEKQIHVAESDSEGYFNFSLYNFNGVKDFYIRTELGADNCKIQILNEFLNSCIPKENTSFYLPINKKSLIEEMYLNKQLSSLKDSKIKYSVSKSDTLISQFGEPDFKIYLKNFIKLPTLHEVFDEIIPSVRVREENQKFVLSIYDEELNLNYNKPLILLDNIPVFNVDDILKIKPSLINNIEIINKMYIIGDKIFNGIIILNSNSDKFCRITLPGNAKFVKYQGFSDSGHPVFPEYKTDKNKNSKIPDFRNTLYWKSGSMKTKDNTVISFYTSDNCAEYTINLYLINEKGNIIKRTKTFIVEK